MENLLKRDKVGVDDFVLLENYQDKDVFLENLRKRFNEKIIYVSRTKKNCSPNISKELT